MKMNIDAQCDRQSLKKSRIQKTRKVGLKKKATPKQSSNEDNGSELTIKNSDSFGDSSDYSTSTTMTDEENLSQSTLSTAPEKNIHQFYRMFEFEDGFQHETQPSYHADRVYHMTEFLYESIYHQRINDETCPACNTIMCVNVDGYQVTCSKCNYKSTICDNIVSNVPFNDEIDFVNTSGQTASNYVYQNATADILAYSLAIRSKILGRMTKQCPYTSNDTLITCIILCIQQSLNKYDTASITIDDIYACCKAHKWKELYPWITHLFCKITGRSLPKLTHHEDEICTAKFRLVRDVYYKTCKPDDRINFMDYKHVWYKIWENMGAKHLLPFVRLLDAAKLKLQDAIWKRICEHLGWRFIPTEARKKTIIVPLDSKRLEMCKL